MLSHKYRNMMKHIAGLVFSFLLTLCIASFLLLLGCKIGVFNDAIILKQLEKTEYYENVRQAIYDNSVELLLPSGLPDTVLDGVINEEQVRYDSESTVHMGLKGEGYLPDMAQLEECFASNIEKYIQENNIAVGDDTEEGMAQLLEEIKKEYRRCMKFPFISYFVKYKAVFNRIFIPALVLFVVLIALICVILIRMQRWPHRGMRYISYATLAAVLMVGSPIAALVATGVHKRINVSPKYLYDLVVGILGTDLMVFLAVACVGMMIFGVELFVISRMRYKAEHHGRQ